MRRLGRGELAVADAVAPGDLGRHGGQQDVELLDLLLRVGVSEQADLDPGVGVVDPGQRDPLAFRSEAVDPVGDRLTFVNAGRSSRRRLARSWSASVLLRNAAACKK